MTPARKKTKARAKTKASSTRKAAAAKAPARKKAAAKKKAPAKKAEPKKATRKTARPSARAAAGTTRGRAGGSPKRDQLAGRTEGAGASRLGVKYTCFQCGAKFYDLNKPEPICPKCGADQRKRPKRDPRAKVAAASPERPRRSEGEMAPLLDEDEEEVVVVEDELGIGLGAADAPDGGFLENAYEEEEEPE